jgi:hypothetical protein
MNARPGLNIQIANGIGLSGRVARIDQLFNAEDDPVERARISRREFSSGRQESLPLGDTG